MKLLFVYFIKSSKWKVWIAIASFPIILLACTLTSNQNNIEETTTSATTSSQNEKIQDFPQISRVGERELKMDAYTLHFQLTHPSSLTANPNDLVPWINPASFTETTGTFLSYFRTNDPARLDRPNIRVSYVRKEGEHQSSIEALMQWLEHQFLSIPDAKKLSETQLLELPNTASEKKAHCIEIFIPSQNGRSPKYMAFGYIDGSAEYILGFNLTTLNQGEYEQTREVFYELVKSYRE